MFEDLATVGYQFGLGTRANPIASRWARFIKNRANQEAKAMCMYPPQLLMVIYSPLLCNPHLG